MFLLDTNHYSEFVRKSAAGLRLRDRMDLSHVDDFFLAIITPQEVLKGWLAEIQPHRQLDRGVRSYAQFQDSLADLQRWTCLPWSADSADIFDGLKSSKLNIGTLDMRIASIALEYGATILTRNLIDFVKVPGLHVENWLV
ncbi:MAG: type II toxin-antitoxin system VapC family toxin [Prosthecobacter sp.]|uniref:type II toxin-antitoxin system VapC family toxin n=1 Tax=Prosthecobacter sp. TaxID=1965333 RepID=UPI003BB13CFF